MHYERWRVHGDPTVVVERWTLSPEERFWSKVNKRTADECWDWIGTKAGGTGYGHLYVAGRLVLAHRFAYELLVGPIPDGLVIDHLCRNRACCNPDHMEPVTHRQNILRGTGASARAARKTHCPQGHPYDAENTSVRSDGTRRCKACHARNERQRQRARRKQATRQKESPMKLTVTKYEMVEGKPEVDAVVAEEGDVKVTVPFFCPSEDRDEFIAIAKNRAKVFLSLEQERLADGAS